MVINTIRLLTDENCPQIAGICFHHFIKENIRVYVDILADKQCRTLYLQLFPPVDIKNISFFSCCVPVSDRWRRHKRLISTDMINTDPTVLLQCLWLCFNGLFIQSAGSQFMEKGALN